MEWINAEEQLPDTHVKVLVVYYPHQPDMAGTLIAIAQRIETKGTSLPARLKRQIDEQKGFSVGKVTHWMYLPEKPKLKK